MDAAGETVQEHQVCVTENIPRFGHQLCIVLAAQPSDHRPTARHAALRRHASVARAKSMCCARQTSVALKPQLVAQAHGPQPGRRAMAAPHSSRRGPGAGAAAGAGTQPAAAGTAGDPAAPPGREAVCRHGRRCHHRGQSPESSIRC